MDAALFDWPKEPPTVNLDQRFYHGSQVWLEDGAILVPGSEVNRGEAMEDLYLTNDPSIAMQYAAPDGFLYEVEPISDVAPDYIDERTGEPFTFVCQRARIVRCCW